MRGEDLLSAVTASSLLMNYSDRMAEDKKQHHLQNILDHINRLTSLLDDVLQINRAETIGMEFNPALMDVAALCRTLVEDTRQINPDHIVELDITGDEALVAADVKLMRQIISNLLSNAVKYSPKHSKVQVALQFEAEDISVIVKDEGMGIPKRRSRQSVWSIPPRWKRRPDQGHWTGPGYRQASCRCSQWLDLG